MENKGIKPNGNHNDGDEDLKMKRLKALVEKNSFLLASAFSTQSTNLHKYNSVLRKICHVRDSSDYSEHLVSQHLITNMLSMVNYTLTHHHPYNNSSRNIKDTTTTTTKTVEYSTRNDFIEMLLFDSKRGNLLVEFEKIVKYLNDAYFQPVDTSTIAQCSSTLSHTHPPHPLHPPPPSMTDASENSADISGDFNDILKQIKNEYVKVKATEQTEQHKSYTTLNKLKVKNILDTIDLMRSHIRLVETEAHDQYEMYKENVKNNLLMTLNVEKMTMTDDVEDGGNDDDDNECEVTTEKKSPSFHSLEELEKFEKLLAFKLRLGLETRALEYLSHCESSFLYLKYFILCTIAHEPNIAEEIGLKSNPVKYRHFPLYLSLLCKEIENIPFNTHNITFILKDFVKTASLYYMNGITRKSISHMFYKHPQYQKNNRDYQGGLRRTTRMRGGRMV